MHSTFPFTSTSAIVNQLPIGKDREVLEPSMFRQVETQGLGPPKVKDTEDLSSEMEDEKQRQNKTRKELTLITQKVAHICEQYIKTVSI